MLQPPSLCLSQQRESDEVEEVEEDYQLVVIDRSPRSETFPPAESSLVAESQPEHDDTPFVSIEKKIVALIEACESQTL